MNTIELQSTINTFWDDHIIPVLIDYIKIPNKSPSFDPGWKASGHMDRVLELATDWTKLHMPENAKLFVTSAWQNAIDPGRYTRRSRRKYSHVRPFG